LGGDGRRRRRGRRKREEWREWEMGGGGERGKEGGDASRKGKRKRKGKERRREHAKSEHSWEVSAQTTTKTTASRYFPGGARSLASPRFAQLAKLTQ
jgi:hypothetical protein